MLRQRNTYRQEFNAIPTFIFTITKLLLLKRCINFCESSRAIPMTAKRETAEVLLVEKLRKNIVESRIVESS